MNKQKKKKRKDTLTVDEILRSTLMVPVNGTVIKSIGWAVHLGMIIVRFKGGKLYGYVVGNMDGDEPGKIFETLRDADDTLYMFNNLIKGVCPCIIFPNKKTGDDGNSAIVPVESMIDMRNKNIVPEEIAEFIRNNGGNLWSRYGWERYYLPDDLIKSVFGINADDLRGQLDGHDLKVWLNIGEGNNNNKIMTLPPDVADSLVGLLYDLHLGLTPEAIGEDKGGDIDGVCGTFCRSCGGRVFLSDEELIEVADSLRAEIASLSPSASDDGGEDDIPF